MPASGLDLDIGDETDPYVPTPRANVFPRPSSAYPLACVDDENPTTLFDRDDRAVDEVPTVKGRETRSYAAYDDERPTTPARPSQQIALRLEQRTVPLSCRGRDDSKVTPQQLDASYVAAIRRFR
jgi:hypothetical protein